MKLMDHISAGGEGSGCTGPNCGRPSSGIGNNLFSGTGPVKHLTRQDINQLREWDSIPRKDFTRENDSIRLARDIVSDWDGPYDANLIFMGVKDNSGKLLGAIELNDANKDEMWINYLVVHPDVLSGSHVIKGLGTKMMLAAAEEASQGNKAIYLQAITRADGFYKALGMSRQDTGLDTGLFKWSPKQVKEIATHGKVVYASMSKKNKKQKVLDMIKKAIEEESKNPPLITKRKK